MSNRPPNLNAEETKLADVADLAQELHASLLGFDAALTILADNRVLALMPPVKPGQFVSSGLLTHLGNSEGHRYNFEHYLQRLRSEPHRTQTSRTWASSALIRMGDELARHNYFDRAPPLELIRHLRNAVAHGERFRIDRPQNLAKFPAHLTAGRCHWEIAPALNGTDLYDFVSVGDIASIIQVTGIGLRNRAFARHSS